MYFQWLASVVSLQTSIARHLSQKQLNKDIEGTSGIKTEAGASSGKPTASVPPTMKQDRPLTPVSSASSTSSASSLPAEHTKQSSQDSDKNTINGTLGSPTQESVPNGPVATTSNLKSNGPVSLLNQSTHMPNGDLERTGDQAKSRSESSSVTASTQRLKGVDTNTGQSVVKLTVPCTSSGSHTSQSKSIVISSVNKTNSTSGSKVFTAPTGKVLVSTKNISPSNTTSILSPRVISTSSSKVSMVSGSSVASGSKVITVTTPTQG